MCKKVERAANLVIDHVKKSPALNKTVELVDGVIDEINKNFKHTPTTLDSLLSRLSKSTDDEILQIQQKESLIFVGGELIVTTSSTETEFFSMILKLYFQDHLEKVILKEKCKQLKFAVLTHESQHDLKQKEKIIYEVSEPNKQG